MNNDVVTEVIEVQPDATLFWRMAKRETWKVVEVDVTPKAAQFFYQAMRRDNAVEIGSLRAIMRLKSNEFFRVIECRPNADGSTKVRVRVEGCSSWESMG